MTHIIGGPPGLEFEVPLQPGPQVLLKVFSQALHPLVLLVIHEWAHGLQVLSTQTQSESQGSSQRGESREARKTCYLHS